MCEQSSLREDDFCTQEEINKTHKVKSKKKNRKEEEKLKNLRKIKDNKGSDQDYDSDQYIGLTDKENMTIWYDEINETTVSLNV